VYYGFQIVGGCHSYINNLQLLDLGLARGLQSL